MNITKFSRTTFFIERLWLTASVFLFFCSMLSFNRALENLRTMDDFSFTNFLTDREMGCSRKAVSNNYFQKVLLITFISNYANLLQHFIFAHLIEDCYEKSALQKESVIPPFAERFKTTIFRISY